PREPVRADRDPGPGPRLIGTNRIRRRRRIRRIRRWLQTSAGRPGKKPCGIPGRPGGDLTPVFCCISGQTSAIARRSVLVAMKLYGIAHTLELQWHSWPEPAISHNVSYVR